MNFNLQFSILAMTIAALLSGRTLAASSEESQTNRRLRGNNQQLLLTSTFCPEYNPGSNTACSLTGMYVGTCYYSSSAKNAAEAFNTDSQACSCNANKSGTFVCTSQPFPIGFPEHGSCSSSYTYNTGSSFVSVQNSKHERCMHIATWEIQWIV